MGRSAAGLSGVLPYLLYLQSRVLVAIRPVADLGEREPQPEAGTLDPLIRPTHSRGPRQLAAHA